MSGLLKGFDGAGGVAHVERHAAGHEEALGVLRVAAEYFVDGGQRFVVLPHDEVKFAEFQQGMEVVRKFGSSLFQHLDGVFGVVRAGVVQQHVGHEVVVGGMAGIDGQGLAHVGEGFVVAFEFVVHDSPAVKQRVVVRIFGQQGVERSQFGVLRSARFDL